MIFYRFLLNTITILLDGSFSEAKILDFLDMSYDLIDGAGRKEENVSGLQ